MKKSLYPITGTFIDEVTYDIPASNWTGGQWAADLDHMKAVGMDTLVFIRGAFDGKAIYPSSIFPTLKTEDDDLAGLILREAAKRDMKVYMGTYISNLTWNDGDFRGEVKQNKKFIKEILARYGDMPSLYGWYIPHEYCDRSYHLREVMEGISALCKDATPEKKVLISPFFRTPITFDPSFEPFSPERTAEEWDYIWEKCGKDIDACAFQDATAPLAQMGEYFAKMREVCDRHKISLWANTETFERDVRRMYYPIPFDLLRRKIELVSPHVDKLITFEFSHFLSPQSIYPSAHNLNALYRKYYEEV